MDSVECEFSVEWSVSAGVKCRVESVECAV